jgi:hypothetical protein
MNARLPELYRNLTLRKALAAMPLLSADEHHLPDQYLLRASALVSAFAHAYYYIEPDQPSIPESILPPWEQIAPAWAIPPRINPSSTSCSTIGSGSIRPPLIPCA